MTIRAAQIRDELTKFDLGATPKMSPLYLSQARLEVSHLLDSLYRIARYLE